MDNLVEMEGSTVFVGGRPRGEQRDTPWKAHLKFNGVFMKDLLVAVETENTVSLHLVRIEPGHAIGRHVHEGSMELHEVLSGSGTATVQAESIRYGENVVSLIPANAPHSVAADGTEPLVLLATFAPPLC